MMSNLSAAVPHVRPYFLTAFGSFLRMDYGSGHETSFAVFLLCLTLVRFLRFDLEEARDMVLDVFFRYLRLCWRLQDVYRLEPAGSHGVWGLDDSHFLGYIFGSAQLRGLPTHFIFGVDGTTIPLTEVASCRPERCPRVSDTAVASTPDEPVLPVNHANPRSQAWAVPRAFLTAVRYCHWSGHLA